MKKILLSSIVLTAFSASIVIFQISCQKTAIAQSLDSTQILNKTLLAKNIQLQVGTVTDSLGI